MSFKENIIRIRKEKNISEEAMAKALACTIKEFQELEGEEREPNLQELIKISGKLDVSIDYLLDNEKKRTESKKIFDPFSALAGMALPGGFSLEGSNDFCDDIDEELALELAEMVSAIDLRRERRKEEQK